MADNMRKLSELVAAAQKLPPIRPIEFFYPEYLVKEAAETFKDQNWYINGHDGSQFYHGEQIKWPYAMVTNIDLTRLNEKIATNWQPNYPRQLHTLAPEDRTVYLLGEWRCGEEGEDGENP